MQPVVRALSALTALARHPDGMTLADLAREVQVPQGSMHRLLGVLTESGFATRSPSNRQYFLGPAARQLTVDERRHHNLLAPPHPALARAAAETGETVFLAEIVGDRVVCVSLVESTRPLRMFVQIGQEMPLHASAAARCLLSDLPDDEARLLLGSRPRVAYTPGTITDLDEVMAHLALVRARGYDVCDDELDRGVWAFSTPVRSSTGRVVASVTLCAPGSRVRDADRREQMGSIVQDAARSMAADLGWDEPATEVFELPPMSTATLDEAAGIAATRETGGAL